MFRFSMLYVVCCMLASDDTQADAEQLFVRHVGSICKPGCQIHKMWEIMGTGTCCFGRVTHTHTHTQNNKHFLKAKAEKKMTDWKLTRG